MPLARLDSGVKHIAMSINMHDTVILTCRKVGSPNKIGEGCFASDSSFIEIIYLLFFEVLLCSTVNERQAFLLIQEYSS